MSDRSSDFLPFLRQADIAIAFLPDRFSLSKILDGPDDGRIRDLQAFWNDLDSIDSFLTAELVNRLKIILHLGAEFHMTVPHVWIA
jgi:hypothetical protein